MFEFLRIQYRMGKLTAEQLRAYAPRWVTEAQCSEIVGDVNAQ